MLLSFCCALKFNGFCRVHASYCIWCTGWSNREHTRRQWLALGRFYLSCEQADGRTNDDSLERKYLDGSCPPDSALESLPTSLAPRPLPSSDVPLLLRARPPCTVVSVHCTAVGLCRGYASSLPLMHPISTKSKLQQIPLRRRTSSIHAHGGADGRPSSDGEDASPIPCSGEVSAPISFADCVRMHRVLAAMTTSVPPPPTFSRPRESTVTTVNDAIKSS